MLYAIYALDVPDSKAARMGARPDHLQRLRNLHAEGRLVLAGPMPRVDAPSMEAGASGSVIIAEFDNLEAAKAWASEDPYRAAGVYASVDIRPFIKVEF